MPDRPPSPTLETTDRTRLRRKRERGSDDKALAEAILDEGIVCHVGFVIDGSPHIVPMAYARIGDDLYLHGAVANRTLRHVADGGEVCAMVTLVDGLVLARSAFHHSLNYRSVIVYGRGTRVEDPAEIDRATAALLDHMAPGRAGDARMPTDVERRSTLFVRLPIAEGSVKVRTGGPVDDPPDMGLGIWAGVVPFVTSAGFPEPDPEMPADVAVPDYVAAYSDRRRRAPG